MAEIEIVSKYNGKCKRCGGNIPVGTSILWSKATGARHVTCPTTAPSASTETTPSPAPIPSMYVVPEDRKDAVVTVSFHDGEYLSGWVPSLHAEKELEGLKVSHYVSGWGNIIDDDVVKALGKEFTLRQVEDFVRPKREAEAKAKALAAAKKADSRIAKFDEAKRTGKPVILRQWSDECNDPNEECDIDNITEYAMPDGTTKTTRTHTW